VQLLFVPLHKNPRTTHHG